MQKNEKTTIGYVDLTESVPFVYCIQCAILNEVVAKDYKIVPIYISDELCYCSCCYNIL